MATRLFVLLNNRWLLIGGLLLFALVLNREGDHMPTGNEFVYLLYFYKAWHPTFLATDWTFQETTAGHAIFNLTLGWLTRLMSITSAAWVGRVCSWVVTYIALFRLGRHFKLPNWAVAAGILLWLLQRQSPVTGEWMIGTFEAKVIAYPCLLFAIDAVLSGRNILAGVLCGIAFSFHSAVGMWGGAALGVSVLLFCPIRQTIAFSIATVLFSLPGLITSWSLVMGPHAISAVEAKYLTTIALPDCNDAANFPHTWMAVLFLLPIFSILHAQWRKNDRQILQLLVFDLSLAIFFAFGVFSRIIGKFNWVELFPMRVYAVFALLLFFWRAMDLLIHLVKREPTPRLLWAVGLMMFLSMPSPVLQLRDMIGSHLVKYLHPPHEDAGAAVKGSDADFVAAAKWVADPSHTHPTDLVIAPPWQNDGYFYIQRALIVNWHAPRYDRMTEWKDRIETLVGDTSHLTYEDGLLGEMDARCWAHYAALTPADIANIQQRYPDENRQKAKWLISTGKYDFPVVFSSGGYRVYRLPAE